MRESEEKAYRLVLIEWVDSYGCTPSWESIADIKPEPFICQSVGWLLYDDEKAKVIVPHLSQANHPHGNRQGCGDMTIPTVAVLSITDLRTATVNK